MANRFQVALRPQARAEAVVRAPQVRFTVLSPALIRLEYSPTEQFEDRASQVMWYRDQPVPDFAVSLDDARVIITTSHLRLTYLISPRGFTRDTLLIQVKATDTTWRYGDMGERGNLRGTARTLDGVNGATRLERGLLSRAGWAVVDDAASLVFDEAGWLTPRQRPDNVDVYFLGHGHDYRQALRDYCAVAGRVPLVPRWILGNWWSRYWAYTQAELMQLMQDFRAHEIPLAVCIVDMDWHITHTGNESSGWTGYTWNRHLFPEPEKFIAWLHEQGLKTALNLHPADGVYPHEAQYAAMAQALGRDPQSGAPIPFEIANPQFTAAYFDILHHPQEEAGVDFWWLDWQQGTRSTLAGLDPLMWLNHLHFLDLGRDRSRRSFIFSRWPGLGGHRYPIGFSGDSVVSWESLAFQPYFTATAANVAFGWWSHDIGGHMRGMEDPELYVRWTQFGVFSPILRVHSTSNPYQDRRPWAQDAETLHLLREVLQLRHMLIPYLYTMAQRTATDDQPLSAPLYYDYPEDEQAYRCPNQYLFGTELIAAPFVSPRNSDTQLSRQTLWLPRGRWFNFWDGEAFDGNRWLDVYGTLAEVPVFARAGAIVPLGERVGWGGVDNPAVLDLLIFPGADNRFELYEDDGASPAYQDGHFATTVITQRWRADRLELTIGPVTGDQTRVPPQRTWRVQIRGVRQPDRLSVRLNHAEIVIDARFDAETDTLSLMSLELAPWDVLSVALSTKEHSLVARHDAGERRAAKMRRLLRTFRLASDVKAQIDRNLTAICDDPRLLGSYALSDAQVAVLTSTIRG